MYKQNRLILTHILLVIITKYPTSLIFWFAVVHWFCLFFGGGFFVCFACLFVFKGRFLWLLPTHTTNHLCQPISPPACPQLYSFFLVGSMKPQTLFLALTQSPQFPTELQSQRYKGLGRWRHQAFPKKCPQFHQGNGIRTELISQFS